MKQKITMLILFIGFNAIAQVNFEKGYFVTNDGKKTECLIKNEGWLNNPVKFYYKKNDSSKLENLSITDVKEFSIYGINKYERHSVKIDISTYNTANLDTKRTLNFNERILFLKLLIKGKANLFEYRSSSVSQRFFYQIDDDEVKQLQYKKYKISNDRIRENKNYLKQLRDFLYCNKVKSKKIKYNKNSLANYFVKFNSCYDNINIINYDSYTAIKKKNNFHLTPKVGITYNNNQIYREVYPNVFGTGNFNSQFSITLSFEFEYTLPFNNNKWGLIFEPTYFNTSASEDVTVYAQHPILPNIKSKTTSSSIDYSSIRLPLILRHYMFLNDKSKFHLNIGVRFFENKFKSSFKYGRQDYKLDFQSNIFFGTGYKYDKLGVELRYTPKQNLLGPVYSINSLHLNNSTIELFFGYTIF